MARPKALRLVYSRVAARAVGVATVVLRDRDLRNERRLGNDSKMPLHQGAGLTVYILDDWDDELVSQVFGLSGVGYCQSFLCILCVWS
jgi:hypothetical protein